MEQTKNFLHQALSSLPDKFKYQDVKSSILNVIEQINKIEKKKQTQVKQQKTIAQEWKKSIETNTYNPYTTTQTLSVIEAMLKDEYKKIKEIQNGKSVAELPANVQELHD